MKFFNIFPLISFLLITLAVISRILYLRSKGIEVNSNKAESPVYKFLLFPVFGVLTLLWIFQLVDAAFTLPVNILPSWLQYKVTESKFLTLTGFVITTASLVLMILSLYHLKESLRFGHDSNNLGQLVTSGVFAISRNPFFLSVNLYFTGLALIKPSLFFIMMALMSVLSIHHFILKEEKFLKKHYSNDYIDYSGKVRRYL
jgi:protein-S-isoprenylcysteine O-methyltransferase Ste14